MNKKSNYDIYIEDLITKRFTEIRKQQKMEKVVDITMRDVKSKIYYLKLLFLNGEIEPEQYQDFLIKFKKLSSDICPDYNFSEGED